MLYFVVETVFEINFYFLFLKHKQHDFVIIFGEFTSMNLF